MLKRLAAAILSFFDSKGKKVAIAERVERSVSNISATVCENKKETGVSDEIKRCLEEAP